MGRRRGNKRKQKNDSINHPRKMPKFEQDREHSSIVQYQDNGMRKIQPYIFKFTTHAKGRWIGKKLMDVFQKEFRYETPLYYKAAIGGGLIRLNGKPVKPDTVFRNHDFLQSRVHRHEPPVSGEPLEIIAQDEDFVVINKPASIPIHPSGKYRHNSITYLMAKEHGLRGLHTFYRLDRLTSGVYILVRSTEKVKKIDSQMRGRELHKVYLSKVNGEFPSEPVECSEPIFAVSHKIGLCRVCPEGKPAKTHFQRVSYDGETSIIKCTPHTGRMHQIRVHLQYLGFPIINDPLYTGDVWGPDQGKGGKIPFDSNEEFIAEMTRVHNKEKEASLIQQDCDKLVSKLNTNIQDREQPPDCDADVGKMPQVSNTESGKLLSSETCEGTSSNSNNSSSPINVLSECSRTEQCVSGNDSVSPSKQDMLLDCSRGESCESSPKRTNKLDEVDIIQGKDTVKIDDVQKDTVCESSPKRTNKLDEIDITQGTDTGDVQKDVVCEDVKDSHSELPKCNANELSADFTDNSSQTYAETKSADPFGKTADNNSAKNTTCPSNISKNEERTFVAGQTSCDLDDETKTNNEETKNVPSSSNTNCENPETGDVSSCVDTNTDKTVYENPSEEVDSEEEERLNRLAMELCRECKEPLPDPKPENMMLYLHALSYKGPDFEFSAPLPTWAKEHMERTGSQMP